MLRIISLNLNGIRSAAKKGWLEWLAQQSADFVCLQELKARPEQLVGPLASPAGMRAHWNCAKKPGYSGVAVLGQTLPPEASLTIGSEEFDAEGRYVQVDVAPRDGTPFSVISLYLPSGSSSEDRQAAKFRFMDLFLPRLLALRRTGREFVVCGDWNIAHQEIDLKNWRSNQKNSGFLPEERAWLSRLLDEAELVDVYRQLHPHTTDDCYTWWSNRGQAWAKNVGWRLDYQIATPGLAAAARRAEVFKAQRFSDHAPLTIDYDWFC